MLRSPALRSALLGLLGVLVFAVMPAGAAERFVRSYTPYLEPRGEAELAVWSTAHSGRREDPGTAWDHRLEYEYAWTGRLTSAAYLNFAQGPEPGAPLTFDSPSLEFIYAFGDRGRVPFDPAFYLECTKHEDAVEIEPKLLFAREAGPDQQVLNLVAEFDVGPGEADEPRQSVELISGASHEFRSGVSLGIEGGYRREFLGAGRAPASVAFGPSVGARLARAHVTVGWQPQVWGSPSTQGWLNTGDFERSEVRAIFSLEL
jgi:hypothetical protein